MKKYAINLLCLRNEKKTGIEKYIHNVISQLRFQEKAKITVFVPSFCLEIEKYLQQTFFQHNVNVTIKRCYTGLSFFRIIIEMLFLPLKTYSFDVVLSVNNFGPLFGKPKQKRLIIIHDVWFMSDLYNGSPFHKLIFNFLLRLQIATTHTIVTVSSFSKNQIAKYFNVAREKIFVTGLCLVQSPKNSSMINSEVNFPDKFLLLIGSDRANKNVYRTLQAYSLLQSSEKDLPALFVVGSYNQRYIQNVKQEIADPLNKITYLGYVSNEQLDVLYQRCIAVCFPSLYEGFGIPAIEALKANKPLMISDNTVCAEITGAAAVVVDGRGVESIAQGIKSLLQFDINNVAKEIDAIVSTVNDCRKPAQVVESLIT